MKYKVLIVVSLVVILPLLLIFFSLRQSKKPFHNTVFSTKQKQNIVVPKIDYKYKITDANYSIFIPYWSLPKMTEKFTLPPITNDQLPITSVIYLGISPTIDGINTAEPGYKNLVSFLSIAPNSRTQLVLQMTNDTITNTILEESPAQQEKIINAAISVAKQNKFSGIILDLEVKGLPTEKLKNEITAFIRRASLITTATKLSFSITLYGDVFYRSRPFDVVAIEPYVDSFFLMAYDLHKATGTPGPNFPLSGGANFDYDLKHLWTGLTKTISPKKIVVIFGLYGYDWIVDEQKRPIKPASSQTLSQIRQKFLAACQLKNCVVRRDPEAIETEINYVDNNTNYHIIWFEDEESVKQKIAYLQKNGGNSFSFWAWGYY